MSTHRLLSGVAASAIALGGLAATAIPASAAQHADSTIVQTTVTGNGWTPNSQGPSDGSIGGAVAPDGEDAAELTTNGDGNIETLFGTQYIGTAFEDISGLSYDTYVANSGEQILAPSIGVEIWGGSAQSFLGSMVYEPYQADPAQPVADGTWQSWNAMDPNALWWSSKAVTDANGVTVIPVQTPEPLSVFESAWAANPAKYSNVFTKDGIKTYVGSSSPDPSWNDFDSFVDNVHVTTTGADPSDTIWDFTTGIGSCPASIDSATQTYTLTADCSTYQTLTIPNGWTLDGAGHTITAVEDAADPSFPGAVVTSATGSGTSAASLTVENLTITTQGFGGGSSGGNLAGIKFDRAGGAVDDVTINGISDGNGIQEGIGLWVRNRDASGGVTVPQANVSIDGVTVTDYQKGGIVLDGNLVFTLSGSTIGTSAGPDGSPLPGIAANALQISRAAHGSVTGNTIGLNDYNPSPPPGDGSDATGILVYDAKTVTLTDNVISGQNGDVGIDTYNDSFGVYDTHVIASCNLISRNETPGDYDPFGVGVATWNDGSTPVDVDLSDTTFLGWTYDTAAISYDGSGDLQFGAGVPSEQQGQCPPSAPTNVSASGGDDQTDVSWTASTAPAYAPVIGYTVTATDGSGHVVATQSVGADATTAHLDGLTGGQDYTIAVEASSGGGSATADVTLYSTSLVLSPAETKVTYHTGGTTLSGTLSSTDPNAQLAGRTVEIQSAPAGSGTWGHVANATVAADGSFSLPITPNVNTDYRALYAGAPDLSSVSSTATVDVAMEIKNRVSAKSAPVGGKVAFDGVVQPNNVGGAVELQEKVGVKWKTLQTHQLDDLSSYGFIWKAKGVGQHLLRVLAVGDGPRVNGESKTAKITVT
jgi:hypothetical protein